MSLNSLNVLNNNIGDIKVDEEGVPFSYNTV